MIRNIFIDMINIDIIFVNLMIMYFLIESAVLCLGPPAKKIYETGPETRRQGVTLWRRETEARCHRKGLERKREEGAWSEEEGGGREEEGGREKDSG